MTITQLGVHRVRHGDVTDAAGLAALMGGDRAGMMYSDPPWGEGNIKFWATMNRKMTGQVVQPSSLELFLAAVFGAAQRYVDSYLLIEYGVRWREMITLRGVAAGFHPAGIIPIQYKGGGKTLPLDLHVFTKGGAMLPQGYAEGVAGTLGYPTLQAAIRPLVPFLQARPVILDPCCGMGYTAQAALDYGLAFRGNELNAARLAKTVARLQHSQG